eukprot:TRINITY_DN6640_c0_g1_i1.p1 TRINITY_DN6640_c0_g1~~TRINITY_DN6640_c0_g1_i1.p1  ORF type:complete len:216 (-),score=17.05 TRINITY_DN6640_c0_g1_i1:356-1003(-)
MSLSPTTTALIVLCAVVVFFLWIFTCQYRRGRRSYAFSTEISQCRKISRTLKMTFFEYYIWLHSPLMKFVVCERNCDERGFLLTMIFCLLVFLWSLPLTLAIRAVWDIELSFFSNWVWCAIPQWGFVIFLQLVSSIWTCIMLRRTGLDLSSTEYWQYQSKSFQDTLLDNRTFNRRFSVEPLLRSHNLCDSLVDVVFLYVDGDSSHYREHLKTTSA